MDIQAVNMEIVIASHNKGKISEIKAIFKNLAPDVRLLTMNDVGLADMNIPETGTTYEQNANIKARLVSKASGKFAIGDDSGLEILALNNWPGLHSARLNGHAASRESRNQIILNTMEDLSLENRLARYVCTVVLADPIDARGFDFRASGEVLGCIGYNPIGENGFAYDNIFMVNGRTYAEIPTAEKNTISHRAIAIKNLIESICRTNSWTGSDDELNQLKAFAAVNGKRYASNACEAMAMD